MLSPELLKNDSFYQLACHTTDIFTSCIKIYEALLSHFEAKTLGDDVIKRLSSISKMLNILYSELTALKNEITTAVIDDVVSEPNVERKGPTKLVSEHNRLENTICEATAVEQTLLHNETVFKKLPERSWEDVTQVPGEEYQREKLNNEDNKIKQTISHDGKMRIEPTDNLKNKAHDLQYICENCNEIITVYNQDLDLSFALHNQDGSCTGKPSKLVDMQKERQKKMVNMDGAQGQVHNQTKYQEATNRLNLTPAQLGAEYKVGDTHFSCIQSVGNSFLCTVCNKKLSSPKTFDEHVSGKYHLSLLNESGTEIQKNTGCGTNVMHAQLVQSCEIKPPASVMQNESILLYDQFANIIKSLSGSLSSQRQYLSVGKDFIECNLCECKIPPTVHNVTDHVLGTRHTKNQTLLL